MDKGRLPKTWKATETSNRLVMFGVLFLRSFRQENGDDITPLQAKLRLDRCFGRSTHQMTEKMQKAIKAIKAVKGWEGYFKRLGLPPPSHTYINDWLRQANHNSAFKGYHDPAHVRSLLQGEKDEKKKKKAAKKKLDTELYGDDDLSSDSRGMMDFIDRASGHDGGGGGGRGRPAAKPASRGGGRSKPHAVVLEW
eukprot:TRINITY_DN5002_c0_g1_i10.p1 TRINITY_DN5002_c0_g1~~TRINITY_DN5002_c0_g1_i10.p1  ORF type:complete len:195 (-),score=32.01 TRINITY_DN5002_c0_g1_i10:140-724(-)